MRFDFFAAAEAQVFDLLYIAALRNLLGDDFLQRRQRSTVAQDWKRDVISLLVFLQRMYYKNDRMKKASSHGYGVIGRGNVHKGDKTVEKSRCLLFALVIDPM